MSKSLVLEALELCQEDDYNGKYYPKMMLFI